MSDHVYPGGFTNWDDWAAAKERHRRRRLRSERAVSGWQRRRREGYCPQGRRVPHKRDRQTALAMAYRAREPTRRQLVDLYLEHGGNQGGAQTFAMIVKQDWRLCRARGVHATTTGPRRSCGLAQAGRPRVPRTVRRHRALARRLGVAAYHHVPKRDAEGNYKDYLRVEMRTLMSACVPQHQQRRKALAVAPTTEIPPASPAENVQLAPPDGGREGRAPPPAAPNCSDEEVSAGAVDNGPPAALPEPVQLTTEQLEADHREAVSRLLRARRGDRRR